MKTRLEKEFLRLGCGNTWGGIRLLIYKTSEMQGVKWTAKLRLLVALFILPKHKGNPV